MNRPLKFLCSHRPRKRGGRFVVCVQYVSMSLAILPVNRIEIVRITFSIILGFVVFVLFFLPRPAKHSLKTFCGVSGFGVLCVCIVNHAEYNISWNSLSFSNFVASGSGDYAREAIGIRGLGL